jgi:ATP-dependent RNA helicase DDX23/PRP28
MKEPISIEELLRRKEEAKNSNGTPKFLTKDERIRLALEKRAKQVEEADQKNKRPDLLSEDLRRRSRATGSGAELRQDRWSRLPQSEVSEHEERDSYNSKASDRSRKRQKFNFEWQNTDDTANVSDPLYSYREATAVPLNGQRTEGAEERERRRIELDKLHAKQKKVDWDDMPWSEKPLNAMKERDWRIFKEDFKILTRGGGNLPQPLRSWKESNIPNSILKIIEDIGYKEPTPIQRAAIPIALTSRDIIGIAETGSGKTASFIVPLLAYIMELPSLNSLTKQDGPYAIILAPTRELAQQIEIEARRFCTPLGFRCVSVVGGHNIEEQAYKLAEGAEIVIATPGRLVDCIERHILVLNQCCYVVMDEADRMIDLGFEEQITKILQALPVSNEKPPADDIGDITSLVQGKRYRQTMMYTATWPKSIERLAEKYLRNPGIVNIGDLGQATDRVTQRIEIISGEEKRKRRLLQILSKEKFSPPVIIFVNLKRNCDSVAKTLNSEGWKAVTMHGSKSQEQRELALSQLRSGQADVLVATDVAGRGIDVPNVSLVVNFQMALSIENYTHRIGRTGRAGKTGVAITFVGKEDEDLYYDLRTMIERSPVSSLPDELRRHEAARSRPLNKKLRQINEDD